jgi:hypothetical protein
MRSILSLRMSIQGLCSWWLIGIISTAIDSYLFYCGIDLYAKGGSNPQKELYVVFNIWLMGSNPQTLANVLLDFIRVPMDCNFVLLVCFFLPLC